VVMRLFLGKAYPNEIQVNDNWLISDLRNRNKSDVTQKIASHKIESSMWNVLQLIYAFLVLGVYNEQTCLTSYQLYNLAVWLIKYCLAYITRF